MALPRVRAILTGEDCPLAGSLLEDRTPLAHGKVKYYGEPVAIVVADNEKTPRKPLFRSKWSMSRSGPELSFGGFDGKAPIQLELLAYMASCAVGGREVRILNSRENDLE